MFGNFFKLSPTTKISLLAISGAALFFGAGYLIRQITGLKKEIDDDSSESKDSNESK